MATELVFYQEKPTDVPMADWLDQLPDKALQKCLARLKRFELPGHELRRPEADFLTESIYELRASYQGVHYRMLYFFHKQLGVMVSHGLTKERAVPPREIALALERKSNSSPIPRFTLSNPRR